VRSGNTAPGAKPDDPAVYPVVAGPQTPTNATVSVALKRAITAKYLVVWLTDTGQQASGAYQIEISEITVKG
jgi:hypothetical protein